MLDKKALGSRIRKLRLKAGITQEVLADMLDVTRTQISDLENGKTSTSLERLSQLADYFKVPSDYLLGRGVFENWELVMKNRDIIFNEMDYALNKDLEKNGDIEITFTDDAIDEKSKREFILEVNRVAKNFSMYRMTDEMVMHMLNAVIEKVDFDENGVLTAIYFK